MEKVENKQTKDFIADIIKKEIIVGNIGENEYITQEELADMLQVSRMPVREAMQKLMQEGFIERLSNRRVKIIKLNKEQVKEALLYTANNEFQVIELLFKNKKNGIDINSIKEKFEDVISLEEITALELELHKSLIDNLENKYISLTFQKLFEGYAVYAIESYGTVDEKKILLKNIIDSISECNLQTIELALKEYYLFYADKF